MSSDLPDKQDWTRTSQGKVVLRLIEEWEAGITSHGDIALSFTSSLGNDPAIPAGARRRSQFICTREDARQIAQMILRTMAFAHTGKATGFDSFLTSIRSPALSALAHHWNEARGARRMPGWKDFHAERLAPHLGHIWGFDYDRGSDAFTGRLAGSAIMQSFGKSFLGTPLIELHPPPAFEPAKAVLVRTLSEPACSRWTGGLYKIGDRIIEGERVVLPMGTDEDHPDGVLGACWFEESFHFRPGEPVEVLHDRVDWFGI